MSSGPDRETRSTNRRSRRRLVVLVLIGLFLCFAGWAIYRAARPPGPLASWPQVPEEGGVHCVPPHLRVPSAECFDDEDQRVLLLAGIGGNKELRLSWTPDDGSPRVLAWPYDGRLTGVGTNWFGEIWTWLGLASTHDLDPALLAAVPPDLPAEALLTLLTRSAAQLAPVPGRLSPQPEPLRQYLGGRTPDGGIGAIPFRTDQCFRHTMGPRADALSPPEASIEVRILRRNGRIRYRWGHFPSRGNRLPRWTGGDVTLTAEQVLAPGRGPLLPGLAKMLRARGVGGKLGPHCRAVLELGPRVTYVDLLRAVECGEGDPAVVWYRASGSFPNIRDTGQMPDMPLPLEEAFGDTLDLRLRLGSLVLQIDWAGVIRKDRREILPERIRRYLTRMTDGGNCVGIAASRVAPWAAMRPVLAGARVMDLSLGFIFRSREVPPSFEPCLFFRPADPASADVRLSVDADPVAEVAVAGRTVLLAVPDGAVVEDVLRRVAELKLQGATGIAFE